MADAPQADPPEPEPGGLAEEPEDLTDLDVDDLENDDGWPADEDDEDY